DGGYGCMHLVRGGHADTLDRAAHLLGVPAERVQSDMATNIAGGAAVLRDTASSLGPAPHSLGDRYAPLAASSGGRTRRAATLDVYSGARTRSVATMYADAVYGLLRRGVTATAQTGELIQLAPVTVQLDTTSAARLPAQLAALPMGCTSDSNVDYSLAVDCV